MCQWCYMCIYEFNRFNLFNLNRSNCLYVVLCLLFSIVGIKQASSLRLGATKVTKGGEENRTDYNYVSSLYLFILRKRSYIFLFVVLSALPHLRKEYLFVGFISIKQE